MEERTMYTKIDEREIRLRKLAFLCECMYEYIQRIMFHLQASLNDVILRTKALEFRDLIQIDKFFPSKSWLTHFRATYNISYAKPKVILTRIPPDSLNLNDIMTYCGKNKSDNDVSVVVPTATILHVNQETLDIIELRRKRKINLMECALYEYLQRATFHHNCLANYDLIRDVGIQLLRILNIEGFLLGKTWLKNFRKRFNFSLTKGVLVKDRRPPLSLHLQHILNYCNRMHRIQLPAKMRSEPSKECKSAKIETNYQSDDDDVIVVENKQELIVIKDDDDNENVNDDIVVVNNEVSGADECDPPPIKTKKFETQTSPFSNSDNPRQSPGPMSEHSGDNDPDTQKSLPNIIRNYQDALQLLKPIKEFAVLEENYRIIGLLSQLEKILKKTPKTHLSDNSHVDNK